MAPHINIIREWWLRNAAETHHACIKGTPWETTENETESYKIMVVDENVIFHWRLHEEKEQIGSGSMSVRGLCGLYH